ncbi:homoserine dehydrogenase [Paramicrobacterium chengjingii]|uniref:homoserine dehydrogenase n=1 Tax=Paramicrobacterium chengjingii TaxID=2769067 RepID=UPI001423E2D4|nr:homoserine dehydrogenase [Microbacterium chengjingii]
MKTNSDARVGDAPIGVALSGAGGGFGRSFLAQLRRMGSMRPSVLVDLHLDSLAVMLDKLGYSRSSWAICRDTRDVEAAVAAGRTALIADGALLAPHAYDVLVEATGNVSAGFALASRALNDDRHVVMVSKEVESVAGVHLSGVARTRGLRYLPGKGDQPANLLALVSWITAVGLDVVAVGKSAEYDLVFDPTTGTASMLDAHETVPELAGLLDLGPDVAVTVAARAEAARSFKRSAAADYCEMAVVAQYTGFVTDRDDMHYPVARPSELADIYRLRADGGLLERPGVVDVFTMLRLPGEASFAGGEFVIVRTGDAETWQLLKAKGHVVSSDGAYACIYSPYHLMGVETPLSVYEAHSGTSDVPAPDQHVVLAGRATTALEAGTRLRVEGHHHEIDGVAPFLSAREDLPADTAPFYLLGGATLVRNVPAGQTITVDDLHGFDDRLWQAFHHPHSLPSTSKESQR